jgi:hypothetical protein
MSEEAPIEERRGPGRPREFVDPSELTIRLDASLHDQILREASRLGISAGAAARVLLAAGLSKGRTPR